MTAYLQQKYQVILEANNYNTYVHGYRISSNIILECDHEFDYLNQIPNKWNMELKYICPYSEVVLNSSNHFCTWSVTHDWF